MIPYESINAAARAALPQLLAARFPAGRRVGAEYLVGDLSGAQGQSLSINLTTGRWADFATDDRGGDPISLFAAADYHGDQAAAARDLGSRLGVYLNGDSDPGARPQPTGETWQPIMPPPAGAPRPPERELTGCDVLHEYCGADDRVLFYVRRHEANGDRRKLFVPLAYGVLNGRTGWHAKHPASPRPLYGLNRLSTMPNAPVIVCEGEKAADAAQRLFPDHACITWPGGSQADHLVDWTPLQGRTVTLWPDADQPGRKAMERVKKRLPQARVLRVDDLPDGVDAADVDLGDDPEAWLRARLPASPLSDDDKRRRLIEKLGSHAWAALEIPPEEKLLGAVIMPGTRTFLVGGTGLGKTLIAYELIGAMASGKGALGWKCDRPSKWLIIDGEMPTALIKQRISDVLRRHPHSPGAVTIYSTGRCEEMEGVAAILGGEMPPLNTPEGHAWVLRAADLMQVDGVALDNLMSLAPGNHAEPDAWRNTEPLAIALSKAGRAVLVLDHTGWNAERQYGSNTKAWKFDSVGIMRPLPEVDRVPGETAFSLVFDPAQHGKCRRRTPDNWHEFDTRTVRLSGGEWSYEASEVKKTTLTREGEGWYRDIVAIFATPGLPKKRTGEWPNGILTLTREELREGLRSRGRIGNENPHVPLTDSERSKLSHWINQLKDAGKIGIKDGFVWLASRT